MQNAHTAALRSMARAANAQSDSLREMTEKTNRDSRSVKILTFVAMMYLPASLIAVSTNFVLNQAKQSRLLIPHVRQRHCSPQT